MKTMNIDLDVAPVADEDDEEDQVDEAGHEVVGHVARLVEDLRSCRPSRCSSRELPLGVHRCRRARRRPIAIRMRPGGSGGTRSRASRRRGAPRSTHEADAEQVVDREHAERLEERRIRGQQERGRHHARCRRRAARTGSPTTASAIQRREDQDLLPEVRPDDRHRGRHAASRAAIASAQQGRGLRLDGRMATTVTGMRGRRRAAPGAARRLEQLLEERGNVVAAAVQHGADETARRRDRGARRVRSTSGTRVRSASITITRGVEPRADDEASP